MTYIEPPAREVNRCGGTATRQRIREALIAAPGRGALNRSRVAVVSGISVRLPGSRWMRPARGAIFGEMVMNMRDAAGLCIPYGPANSQYETQFDPASQTLWGYFKPRGTACYSLGLLKDILAHDQKLVANGARVEVDGALQDVHYYVTGSRVPR